MTSDEQRAAFETAMNLAMLDWNRLRSGDRRALDPAHQWAFDKLASSPSQPEGWKLVPLVADTKMADAMDLAVLRYSADGEYDPTATMRAMYAAALAAAPALVEGKK